MSDYTREQVIKKINKRESLEGLDLTEIDLREADLREANLNKADLCGAKLSKANLFEANLFGANLSQANLIETDLTNANLSWANLSQARLTGADLIDAKLNEAKLIGAELIVACLIGAELIGADLSVAYLIGTKLRDTNLGTVNLEMASLEKADISGANIYQFKTSGWEIDGIKCSHIYQCPDVDSFNDQREREKFRRDFEPGEFEEIFKSLHKIDLIFRQYSKLDFKALWAIIERLNQDIPSANVKLRNIEIALNTTVTLTAETEEDVEKIADKLPEQLAKMEAELVEVKKLLSQQRPPSPLPNWVTNENEIVSPPSEKMLNRPMNVYVLNRPRNIVF